MSGLPFSGPAETRYRMASALYVLFTFAVRRQHIGRLALRSAANNPNTPATTTRCSIKPAAGGFLSRVSTRPAALSPNPLLKRGASSP